MINEHYNGYDAFLRRLDDYARIHEVSYRTICSNYLTPVEQEIVKRYYGKRINYRLVPEFEETIARCLILGDETQEVVCLTAKVRQEFVKLTHRDVYGALMALGLKKDQFGDIWINNDQIVVYTKETIADYCIQNLTQIHQLTVHFVRSNQWIEPVYRYRTLQITTSSYRLDAIVSELAHVSRNKAQQMIRIGNVRKNYDSLVECSDLCHNNDIVSIRQVGRFRILEELAITKKGNIVIRVNQYQ